MRAITAGTHAVVDVGLLRRAEQRDAEVGLRCTALYFTP
jgi:hypothetical protein